MSLTVQVECIIERIIMIDRVRSGTHGFGDTEFLNDIVKCLVAVLPASATLASNAEPFIQKWRFARLAVIGLKPGCPHSLWSCKDLIYD